MFLNFSLETYMKKMLQGPPVSQAILWILSLLYQAGVRLRHKAYEHRLLSSTKVPAVVVSIGNIVAGGTGKTPLVYFLAEELSKEYTVAILSRGYRSRAGQLKHPLLVQPRMQAEEVGDEPLWLAQKLPHVQVWVGPNRVASAFKAIEKGAQIVLLDDGFQHRRLQRDFDVVVVAGDHPYSNGYFLPRGYLRDLPSRLNEATMVAVMGGSPLNISRPFSRPWVLFEKTSSLSLEGRKVAAFCAIGNPDQFLKQLQLAGAHIVASMIKPDHSPFNKDELELLAHRSRAELLVCTEKDYVKLALASVSLPILPFPLEVKLKEGHEAWKQFINQIKLQVQHVRVSSHPS